MEKMTFQDVKDNKSWDEFVYQEAFVNTPETFYHKDQWHQADSYVFDSLTEDQQEYLEKIGCLNLLTKQ